MIAELEMTVSVNSEIEREVQEEAEGKASWPYATLLFFGFFGTATPEGRRLAQWTALATVGAFIGGAGLASGWPSGPGRLVWAALAPAMMILLAIAYVRYLAALDELARLIQLQAFAVAYGFTMVVAAGFLAYAFTAADPDIHGAWAAGMVALAEVVRGAALAFFARRHE
ncbi:MAG TPA: hypothetical protein VIK91_26075 [Nannocystis sp.]